MKKGLKRTSKIESIPVEIFFDTFGGTYAIQGFTTSALYMRGRSSALPKLRNATAV